MTAEIFFAKNSNGHNGNGCQTENPHHIPKDIYRDSKRRMPKRPKREPKK